MGTLIRRLRARSRGPAIPVSTTAALSGPARRTLILRIGLAAALLALVVAASGTGRSDADAARGLIAKGGSGMLILDVSRSIKPDANRTIVEVLERLIASRSRIGRRRVFRHRLRSAACRDLHP